MWIKVGAGLSAVIVVLFFSACTYTTRRRTNLRTGIHVICTESPGTKFYIIYMNYLVSFYILAGDFQMFLRYNLDKKLKF